MRHRLFTILFGFLPFLASGGCGYGFQNSKNPLYLKEGIQKIYVEPVVNNTYKAGVENVVYNNLVRTIASHGRVTVVHNRSEADAILQGTVLAAVYGASYGTSVGTGLNPTLLGQSLNLPTQNFFVSTEYTASLLCSFTLVRRVTRPKQNSLIWTSNFSRSKAFPAANQLDVPGTTSALINDSEFDRALGDISRTMMDDVHESMLAMF